MDGDKRAKCIDIYKPINYSKKTYFKFMDVPDIGISCITYHMDKNTLRVFFFYRRLSPLSSTHRSH